jgi:hypothetical protein
METLSKAAPLLRLLGNWGRGLAETLDRAPTLASQAREFAVLPERFNELLGPRGWIAYEQMKHETLKEATRLADAGDFAAAENLLVESIDEKALKYQLMWMSHVAAFKPRSRLLRLAAEDYLAGRYHASTPVVLAQIDGLVADVAGRPVFNDIKKIAPKLVVWDSISATEGGLPELFRTFASPRYKTTDDMLDVPYRHGILHGRDLGYANRTVAAKAWAALFALRDWALKFERGEIDPPPVEPQPSLRQVLAQYARAVEYRKAVEAWRPRPPFAPSSGEDLDPESPEAAVVAALDSWRAGAVAVEVPWLHDPDTVQVALAEVRDTAAAVTEVDLQVTLANGSTHAYRAVAMYRDKTGTAVLRGAPDGEWAVVFRRPPRSA